MDIKIERDPGSLDVSIETVEKFFKVSPHADFNCPVCQNDTWEYPNVTLNDENEYAGRTAISLIGSKYAMSAIPAVCSNCGNTRLIAVHVLQKWIAQYEAEQAAAPEGPGQSEATE